MNPSTRDRIMSWYQAGLDAVDPEAVTSAALKEIQDPEGRLVILSIGKAAVPMAKAAAAVLGNRIDAGLAVTKGGFEIEDVPGFHIMVSAHPVPDDRSVLAGERMLDLVNDLSSSDMVIALISGGGSSLVECPKEGVSLMDMQVTTELLMHAGAGIYELNTVRRALSAIKAGGLRAAMGDAQCCSLMLSDVIGNDQQMIASGPTIPGHVSRFAAWQVIEDLGVAHNVPEPVRTVLTSDQPPTGHVDSSRDVRRIIADNQLMLNGIASRIQAEELAVHRAWMDWQDDARELGHQIIRSCREAPPSVDVLIGGGEATSKVWGNGKGGRNTETALVAASLLQESGGWIIASLASDGDDGNSGTAGAIVDRSVADHLDDLNIALETSDSAGYLATRGALIITGPTGTNVNDVYIAARQHVLTGELV